ncbi:hypothetical protein EVAR_44017_1 [Eumeta japonica]|uniref:Uncharacterized protein n=1 Tax=Eumeta variegata TaxID=151549 RepID=A0A4C1XCH2_EUMVA|nr:hypothetical protein EVAR_44017_1 [Eumeta japonica]
MSVSWRKDLALPPMPSRKYEMNPMSYIKYAHAGAGGGRRAPLSYGDRASGACGRSAFFPEVVNIYYDKGYSAGGRRRRDGPLRVRLPPFEFRSFLKCERKNPQGVRRLLVRRVNDRAPTIRRDPPRAPPRGLSKLESKARGCSERCTRGRPSACGTPGVRPATPPALARPSRGQLFGS